MIDVDAYSDDCSVRATFHQDSGEFATVTCENIVRPLDRQRRTIERRGGVDQRQPSEQRQSTGVGEIANHRAAPQPCAGVTYPRPSLSTPTCRLFSRHETQAGFRPLRQRAEGVGVRRLRCLRNSRSRPWTTQTS